MMTAEEAAESGKTLTFEKVWAAFVETDRKMAENAKLVAEATKKAEEARAEAERQKAETDRQMAETDRQMAETDRKLKDLMKTVDRVTKNVGGLNRSMGALIETLIAARLWEKFPQYNLTSAAQRVSILDEKGEVKTDIDILLINSTVCIAVEVKHELNHAEDIDHHIKRMELIRHYRPELVKDKQLLGAMAGGTVDPDVKNYAYRAGFFVLGLSGESVRLVPPPKGFTPKTW